LSFDRGARLTNSLSPPLAPDSAPDWTAVTGDVVCPLCEYNLRGLTEPRCPECGYQFKWRDLTDPKRRKHPYIFEHHPRRNVWSFMRTAIGGLRPWKFWSSLRPDQTSRPKRLVAYWVMAMVIVLLLLVVGCAAIFAGDTARYNSYLAPRRTYYVSPGLGAGPPVPSRVSYLNWRSFRRTLNREGGPFWGCWAGCLAWPWLTAAILMIFRVSMRRAKVNAEHVLRCVLYSGDAFIWPALLLTAALWTGVGLTGLGIIDRATGSCLLPVGFGVAILCLLPAVKLWAAYQRYLRFRHALWTIIASQVILVLGVLAVISNISYYLFSRRI